MTARIPTYFSHSYRPDDRELNLQFFRRFWERGFAFTVDPASDRLVPAHLERLMRSSACFVAVAPYRPEQRPYRTSPFIVYEYALAVRAGRPRLVWIEDGVPTTPFQDADLAAFWRDDLEHQSNLGRWIAELEAACRPCTGDRRETRSVGLV